MNPKTLFVQGIVLFVAIANVSSAAPPHVTNDRYQLELIASDPEIVTPIGMAFDRQGRLLVIESHTHQRPNGYLGPKSDRVRMLSDSNGDGKLDKWSTFAEGFRHAMNLLVREDGAVYVVTRKYVFLLRDTDNDGVADKRDELLRLETEDDYPHNALSGIARDVDGSLIISFGENHGDPYRLIGADGTEIKDGGGQDGFYRMSADGKGLHRFARGVWNPFSVCVLPDGRIFAVDNDPDASPPCRLLHVVPGGDYGYLYQYGRAGTHPLQAWNGELPGTLPMVCGVGEGPTAIVPHAGGLWVTSWGDHRIERYELEPRGASYGAKRDVIVQGDADFRPTGMAVAPDGSLYFADWVLRDYPVHGKGRIWRLTSASGRYQHAVSTTDARGCSRTRRILNHLRMTNMRSPDKLGRFRTATISRNSRRRMAQEKLASRYCIATEWNSSMRYAGMGLLKPLDVMRTCLAEKKAISTQLFAIRWIADDRITALRDEVAKLLDGPQPNPQLYLATLGAIDWLDHKPGQRTTDFTDELLVRELSNKKRTPETCTHWPSPM